MYMAWYETAILGILLTVIVLGLVITIFNITFTKRNDRSVK